MRRIREEEKPGAAQRAWRDAVARSRDERPDDVWIDEGPVEETKASRPRSKDQSAARRAGDQRPQQPRNKPSNANAAEPAKPSGSTGVQQPRQRATRTGPPPRGKRLPGDVVGEVAEVVPPSAAPKVQARLGEAVKAYERDRYQDALAILRPVADRAPTASAVRELLGLTYYRMGRWKQAIKELEAFRTLTQSFDQHPTLADCYRALGRYEEVDDLYRELAEASPGAALVAEGRIVAAGALADQGRLADAIRLLEQAKLSAKNPQDHHLRLWFALADLYERAGDVPKARSLFERLAAHDPELYDVTSRLRALG